jgi:hypothetical protein
MKKFLACALFAVSTLAHADFKSGNSLYSDMNSDDNTTYVFVLGYVAGVADALNGVVVCMPANVTIRQVRDISYRYLRDNPEQRNDDASILIARALKPPFPCKKV